MVQKKSLISNLSATKKAVVASQAGKASISQPATLSKGGPSLSKGGPSLSKGGPSLSKGGPSLSKMIY